MLFQQPPRSCIGLIEKDGKGVNSPTYTEVDVQPRGSQGYLRIRDVVLPCTNILGAVHPLLDEGLLWYGFIRERQPPLYSGDEQYPTTNEMYGEISRSQVAYITSICLRDCDIVFFHWVSNHSARMLHV